jgi:hypothetical protein
MREVTRCSSRLGFEWSGRAGVPVSMFCGGAWVELEAKAMQRSSRFLDSTVQLGEDLRRCYRGQEGSGIAGGGLTHLRWRRVQFWPLHGLGSRLQGSRSFLVVRRSYCGAWPGLGRSGAARPRRSRGSARRSEAGTVALGFWGDRRV